MTFRHRLMHFWTDPLPLLCPCYYTTPTSYLELINLYLSMHAADQEKVSCLPSLSFLHKSVCIFHPLVSFCSFVRNIVSFPGHNDVQTQADAFLDRRPTPPFVLAKTGMDIATQIEEGDVQWL